MAQDAYVTMLFSDGYLQGIHSCLRSSIGCADSFLSGAQVLAASLRDGGTTKKLAVIVPSDEAHRLLAETITQLEVSSSTILC
jgi:hypothetical protein